MSENIRTSPKCGEIWMCELTYGEGSIQYGYRPVFVMSNNQNNVHSTTLNVIPLTTKMNKRRLPIHVELWNYQKYGLKKPSTLMVEQITTVSSDKMVKFIGNIDDKKTLREIWRAINIQFPIVQMLNSKQIVAVCWRISKDTWQNN